jgi:hypothetical protein
MSRNGVEHTGRFGDLAAAVSKLSGRSLVLDGEVAIYDQQLRSRFEWLRQREPEAVASPPVFMAFDLLYRDGRDLSARPLRDRRARPEDVVAASNLVFPVRRLAPDGLEAWAQVVERATRASWRRTTGARTRAGRRDAASRSSRRTGRSKKTVGDGGSSVRTAPPKIARLATTPGT